VLRFAATHLMVKICFDQEIRTESRDITVPLLVHVFFAQHSAPETLLPLWP